MPSFVIYTGPDLSYVTTPDLESVFLDWLNDKGPGPSSKYTRTTANTVAVLTASDGITRQAGVPKKPVLKLVKDE